MIKIKGLGNISAMVVADSISNGQRITTYELEYPRFIHSEFMTHRQFSRNAASSRAIPVKKLIELVRKAPAMPIHWGQNQSGMQAKSELEKFNLFVARNLWKGSAKIAAGLASGLNKIGLHKQITNRILEPFQMIKVVCTATEYENFFYLRDHEDAQPEIAELARCMREARDESKPVLMQEGDWHLPYVSNQDGNIPAEMTLEDAIKISASLCAQVSYRKADESLDKALKIYEMLVNMKPVHASPFEHQATPMRKPVQHNGFGGEEGVTHIDTNNRFWSGNLKGWIQNRQLIKGHVYEGEK